MPNQETKNLTKTICFEFNDVLKYEYTWLPTPHAIPMLYKQLTKYKEVYIHDDFFTPNDIQKWLEVKDIAWRDHCQQILLEPVGNGDMDLARFTLKQDPLTSRISFPYDSPECDIHVMKADSDNVAVIKKVPFEEFEKW